MSPTIRFQEALSRTIYYEGPTSNDPDDPGGSTKMGISTKFLRDLGDDRDARDLKELEIFGLYLMHFWDKCDCDKIYSDLIAFKLFDMAVNLGPHTAVKLLQEAINEVNGANTIAEDGVIGPITLQYVNNKEHELHILGLMREFQADYYVGLVLKNPKLQKFINGWTRRAAW